MVTEIRIYFEGADDLREGFRNFFREIEAAIGRPPNLIAGGGRERAIGDFRKSLRSHPAALNLLLIDSEGPDTGALFEMTCQPLRIPETSKDRVFWMVQCMECWFLADIDALCQHYGPDVRGALHGNPRVEEIPKKDAIERLDAATRRRFQRRYHKTKDALQLLKRIRPERVKQAAPHCRRLFDAVAQLLSNP
jgi:hypothetical protein